MIKIKTINKFIVLFLVFLLQLFVYSSIKSVVIFGDSIASYSQQRIENELNKILSENDKEFANINYHVEDIYITNTIWGGWVVDFNMDNDIGYIILYGDNYNPIEVNFGRYSPFYKKTGKNIYPSIGCYFIYLNGRYYNAETMEETKLDLVNVREFQGAKSSGDKEGVYTKSTIKYKYGYKLNEKDIMINGKEFYYGYGTSISSAKNNCSNIAGLTMLNYWNQRTRNQLLKLPLTNLAQGRVYDADMLLCDGFMTDDTRRNYPKEFADLFYNYMKTNTIFGTGGTTPSNMYNGFERLIKEKGYGVTRKTNLSWTDIMDSIDNGIPVFVTSTDYYFTYNSITLPNPEGIPGNNLYDYTTEYLRWSGLGNSHSFVAYGYATYMLYDEAEDLIPPLCFLKVADGWEGSRYYNYTFSTNYDLASIRIIPKS